MEKEIRVIAKKRKYKKYAKALQSFYNSSEGEKLITEELLKQIEREMQPKEDISWLNNLLNEELNRGPNGRPNKDSRETSE